MGEGFVEQEHRGHPHGCPPDRDPLPLAGREGARLAVHEPPEPDEEESEGAAISEGSPLERPPSATAAERAVDPRLDIFRDFVNSLGSDQESEGTGAE